MCSKKTITILTPTFNRKKQLLYLYQSLQKQTCKDFEWLIVDDGSIDNTEDFVAQIRNEADFKIHYFYKENGGKHTALNAGIKVIESKLTFIVDSDDQLTSDAIEKILHYHLQYSKKKNLCGYVFLRSYPDGKINGKPFKRNEMVASYIDARVNADDTHADKAEVFFTQCLKEYPFPEYPGEKFLGEDIIWLRMAEKYKMVHINQVIYISDYLNNGLTQNRRKNNIESPVGCMHRAETFLKANIKFKYKIKASLQYVVYGKFAGHNIIYLIKKTSHKFWVLTFYLPGIVIYRKWTKENREK